MKYLGIIPLMKFCAYSGVISLGSRSILITSVLSTIRMSLFCPQPQPKQHRRTTFKLSTMRFRQERAQEEIQSVRRRLSPDVGPVHTVGCELFQIFLNFIQLRRCPLLNQVLSTFLRPLLYLLLLLYRPQ